MENEIRVYDIDKYFAKAKDALLFKLDMATQGNVGDLIQVNGDHFQVKALVHDEEGGALLARKHGEQFRVKS